MTKKIKLSLKFILILQIFFFKYFLIINPAWSIENEEIREKYGVWQKICNLKNLNCVGSQFAIDSEGNKIGRLIITKATKNNKNIVSIANIFFPFEKSIVNLRSGLLITVDQLEPLNEQFYYCDKKGCNARIQFSSNGNNALINGSNLTIKFKDIKKDNQIQVLDISLLEYGKMFENLKY